MFRLESAPLLFRLLRVYKIGLKHTFMLCPKCQADNPAHAAFCDQCGARLEKACPNCGEPNRYGARFCRNCGQTIAETLTQSPATIPEGPAPDTYVPKHLAEKILASRHKLEGERKQVTVLFADIRGSTKILEGLDPEEGQKIIDPVLRVMMDAVHRYEGTVNQVLGDGIMALFGAPLAHEDHTLRACYAALAMQDEMRRHRQKLSQTEEFGLQIGVGIHSGEVVVRSIDNDLNIDYSALGHTTHLAARMQELAGPGEALISQTTLRQVEGFVQTKSLGPIQVKGVSHPVDVYSLTAATAARTRVQAGASRGLTPLVGRGTEVELFRKLADRVSAGRGQILAMIGEAGLGKSRLVHEFTRHQLPTGWLVLEASSVSYGTATPYFPLVEMLRRYFNIAQAEDARQTRDKVITHVLELDIGLKDAIPPILSLLGILPDDKIHPKENIKQTEYPSDLTDLINRFSSIEPQQRRRYTLDALKRVCVRESTRQSLLLVFEDLHWIDHETQAFLDVLVDSIPMVPLLLLLNYRPGYSNDWSEKSYYTQLRVEPLPVTNAEELLSMLLGKNPDLNPLKRLLIERTEGNPFFAEESVRSLVETGVLTGEKGGYRPALQVEHLAIPSTVQNVVAGRIDRLPTDEKHLLQTAAVIGVNFPLTLLRRVTELSDENLQVALSHLQSAEFLYETTLFPNLEYTFKHALINEVAYRGLLQERRRLLHSRVVAALEEVKQESASHDHLEKLAHHALQGELWEKAANYLELAATKAAGRSANQAAASYYYSSLAALQHLPQDMDALRRAVDIRLELRNPLFLLGQFDELHSNLRAAEAIAEKIVDHKRLGRVLNFLVGYYGVIADHHRSIESGTRALQINRDDVELNTVTHYYMGVALHHTGQYDQSITMLNRALSAVSDQRLKHERFGTATVISVICRSWLAQCLAQLGNFKEGICIAESGVRIAGECAHAYSLGYAYCSLGFLFLLKGDFELAINALQQSQKICESNEIRVLTTQVNSHLGYAYALTGRVADAIALMEMADRQSEVIGRKAGWALRLTWLAHANLVEGRTGLAREQAQRALVLATDNDERGYQAWSHKLLGDVSLEDGRDRAEALSHYHASLALVKELGMRPLEGHVRLSLGQLRRLENQIEKARTELSLALTLYHDMEMPFWTHATDEAITTLVQ
jgi:class 3 adenylate cyclase/tetratricopeptide (TPR) repeat protein